MSVGGQCYVEIHNFVNHTKPVRLQHLHLHSYRILLLSFKNKSASLGKRENANKFFPILSISLLSYRSAHAITHVMCTFQTVIPLKNPLVLLSIYNSDLGSSIALSLQVFVPIRGPNPPIQLTFFSTKSS